MEKHRQNERSLVAQLFNSICVAILFPACPRVNKCVSGKKNHCDLFIFLSSDLIFLNAILPPFIYGHVVPERCDARVEARAQLGRQPGPSLHDADPKPQVIRHGIVLWAIYILNSSFSIVSCNTCISTGHNVLPREVMCIR